MDSVGCIAITKSFVEGEKYSTDYTVVWGPFRCHGNGDLRRG